MQTGKGPKAPRGLRWACYGAGVGVIFPVLGTLVAASSGADGMGLNGIVAAQLTNPLLWIIDSAPLVLGLVGLLGAFRERRHRERLHLAEARAVASAEMERRLASLLHNFPSSVIVAEPDGTVTSVHQVEGEEHPESVGGKLWDFVPPLQRVVVRSAVRRAKSTSLPVDFEVRAPDGRGGERWFDNRVGPVVANGAVTALLLIKRDVTAARRRESEQRRLAKAVEQSNDAILVTAPEGTILYANPAFESVSGYALSALIGQRPSMLKSGHQDADFYDELWRTISNGRVWTGRLRNRRSNGDLYIVAASIYPIVGPRREVEAYVAIQRDITERLVEEAQSQHARKMESVGQLAAGIAHEINTPTQFVGDNVTFLGRAFDLLMPALEQLEESPNIPQPAQLQFLREEIPQAIEHALDGVQRVASIVRAMKEFSHPSDGQRKPVDIHQAIDTTLRVARNEWRYVATVERQFDLDLPAVTCCRDEVNQVLLNVIVNAAHAIAEKIGRNTQGDKGVILMQTRRSGDYAVIRVSDNGMGIPATIRHKIFDPFFTTKAVGQGTGQGLALTHSVITKHGGTVDVESEEGEGTTFVIRLPFGVAAEVPAVQPAAG